MPAKDEKIKSKADLRKIADPALLNRIEACEREVDQTLKTYFEQEKTDLEKGTRSESNAARTVASNPQSKPAAMKNSAGR